MSTMIILLLFIGLPLAAWYLEARDENGAAQRAEVNRMADRARRQCSRGRDKPCAFGRRGSSQRLWKRGYSI